MAKEASFYLLGYKHIFIWKVKNINIDIEQRRIDEMDEALRKLFKMKSPRHLDTEWWRTVRVQKTLLELY